MQRDNQPARQKPARDMSDGETAAHPAPFNPSPYDSLSHTLSLRHTHPRLRVMCLNREEMKVTESVVTVIKYHSWRLTGLQGPLTDTIHGEWKEAWREKEEERKEACRQCRGKRWQRVGHKSPSQRLISQGLQQDKYFAYRSNTLQSPPLTGHAQ